MSNKMFYIALILLMLNCIYTDEEESIRDLSSGKTLLAIKEAWLKKDARKLQYFFAEKIYLDLDKKIKNMYSREQATGIFKTYFQDIEIQEFSYYTKKTKSNKGMILYRYKEITTGKKRQKIIYICLKKYIVEKEEVWLIYRINIIG